MTRQEVQNVEDALLRTEDIHAGYGETQVLHGVSLNVNGGEAVSLIGRNGAGKTTTLRTILGIINPTQGSVYYRGEDITTVPQTKRIQRGIAFVPEDRRIFPGLTVRENLRLSSMGGAKNANRREIDEVLDMFENLKDRQENKGAMLSGGEQQMLAIARALVGGADLLLLDEPTEGLAPYIVKNVKELIGDLNQEGMTILLVEQNVRVALEATDRVYIIDKGEIVYEDTTDQLREDKEIMDRYLGVTV